ncbi:hypothetical protein MLD38_024952 [Melastoma candidum]|uniref:Uncharacterized protein n=1 Tax=Melastoma candidum TaxID=119954 RepID=A0ACB9NUU6_9MYRT|nr:hypothetical protein MLD38_024952 [Melastoma candidum]
MNGNGLRRKLTMNWDGLGNMDDDDDRFFESNNRISSFGPLDLHSSGSDDDDFDEARMSFASAISPGEDFRSLSGFGASTLSRDYDIWMAEPGSITERRNRLLQGMGLAENGVVRIASKDFGRIVSSKVGGGDHVVPPLVCEGDAAVAVTLVDDVAKEVPHGSVALAPVILVRSRSDGDIDFPSVTKRKESFFGATSKQRLIRTSSTLSGPVVPICRYPDSVRVAPARRKASSSFRQRRGKTMMSAKSSRRFGAFFLIKNLDTGKEFIVKEYNDQGMWNRLSDPQTGQQLTMEEFEKCVGHSPVITELMRRENGTRNKDGSLVTSNQKMNPNNYFSKSLRMSKKSGAALLKNIKGVANSMSGLIADKERENQPVIEQKPGNNTSEWIKVRQHGKSHKELSALHFCQEIQAHEGSIWTMKFDPDGRYLASAGEDRMIHIWEVQECEIMPTKHPDEWSLTPSHSFSSGTEDGHLSADSAPPLPTDKKKKGKNLPTSTKGNLVPDYVYAPESMFSLTEKPVCSFKGHSDDVLDLSWSRSQHLLSSSMDKTVRLWDMETKCCLKMFAHGDYVTCIQFNPVDDRYFISGSLDAKIRIWSIPERMVVDWTDLHEMITAVCYTADGQGAIIGTHKGNCRLYSTEDCKLNQLKAAELHSKKKTQTKKITGLQAAPWHPSEVLVTSADSRIRVLDGSEVTQKLKGFRNTGSQISASFTQDEKYVISASEDSQVYVWKRELPRGPSTGKGKEVSLCRSYENFHCADVSVAIPWPGTIKGDPPAMPIHSKRQPKRTQPQPQASNNASPTREDPQTLTGNSKRQLPPLPKKTGAATEKATTQTPTDEELSQLSRIDSSSPGLGESFNSEMSSMRYTDPSSIAASPANSSTSSWSSSRSGLDIGSNVNGNGIIQPTAWGMVIVTAGLGGEIRAYQNFGLPRKIGRQPVLFKDLS